MFNLELITTTKQNKNKNKKINNNNNKNNNNLEIISHGVHASQKAVGRRAAIA